MRCKLRKLYIKCLWVNQQGIACTHPNKGHVWSREEYGVGRAALRFYYTWQGNCAWQDFRFIEILQVIRCIVCRSKHWIIKKQKKKQNSLLKEPKWHEKSQKSIWLSVLVLTGAESGRRTNQARKLIAILTGTTTYANPCSVAAYMPWYQTPLSNRANYTS